MAFDARNLAFALVAEQGADGRWEGEVGARSCGGTQKECPDGIPFDHLTTDKKDLETLKTELQRVIKAIDKKLLPAK